MAALGERLSLAETGAADAREQLAAASQQLTAARAEADSAIARLRDAEVCVLLSGVCTTAKGQRRSDMPGRLHHQILNGSEQFQVLLPTVAIV